MRSVCVPLVDPSTSDCTVAKPVTDNAYVPATSMQATSVGPGAVPPLHLVPSCQLPFTGASHCFVHAAAAEVSVRMAPASAHDSAAASTTAFMRFIAASLPVVVHRTGGRVGFF